MLFASIIFAMQKATGSDERKMAEQAPQLIVKTDSFIGDR